MKYFEIGKIAFSENISHIGQYLSLSEPNYNMVCQSLNIFIRDKDKCFEDFKNQFFYHIFEETNKDIFEENYKEPLKRTCKKNYKLKIFYDSKYMWEFQLYYTSSDPEALPIEIYEKNIIGDG